MTEELYNIKIISGGQSGVDRAALDFALENDINCGGWCPLGRLAEDGIINLKYPLTETKTSEYKERTNLNIQDSDATIILYKSSMDEGTKLTEELANSMNKPLLALNLDTDHSVNNKLIRNWFSETNISVLNIAGPRESSFPGIYQLASRFLQKLL